MNIPSVVDGLIISKKNIYYNVLFKIIEKGASEKTKYHKYRRIEIRKIHNKNAFIFFLAYEKESKKSA